MITMTMQRFDNEWRPHGANSFGEAWIWCPLFGFVDVEIICDADATAKAEAQTPFDTMLATDAGAVVREEITDL